MNLKPTLLATALAVAVGALALAAPSAHAVGSGPNGTVTIKGLVVGNTCTISSTPAGTGGNFTVTLPTVYTTALNGAVGKTAGQTGFSIAVAGCDTNLSNVSAYWSGTNIAADGNLTNTAATNNVEVQLLNNDKSSIDLSKASGSQNSQVVGLDATGGATLNYYAQYYATATTVASGAVNTTVEYTLVYQ